MWPLKGREVVNNEIVEWEALGIYRVMLGKCNVSLKGHMMMKVGMDFAYCIRWLTKYWASRMICTISSALD
jgi:hypothetical protein